MAQINIKEVYISTANPTAYIGSTSSDPKSFTLGGDQNTTENIGHVIYVGFEFDPPISTLEGLDMLVHLTFSINKASSLSIAVTTLWGWTSQRMITTTNGTVTAADRDNLNNSVADSNTGSGWISGSVSIKNDSTTTRTITSTPPVNELITKWSSNKPYLVYQFRITRNNPKKNATLTFKGYAPGESGSGTPAAIGQPIGINVELYYPAQNNAIIYNKKPYFRMKGIHPNGANLNYTYKIDDGTWNTISNAVSSGHVETWQPSSNLSSGSHTLYIRASDPNTAYTPGEISRSFTYTIPTKLTAGTQIQRSQMVTLKTYIDNLFNYYGISSNTAITVPSQGSSIQPDDWTSYKSKISAAPYVSNSLNEPAKNNSVVMNNYNSYITILENG